MAFINFASLRQLRRDALSEYIQRLGYHEVVIGEYMSKDRFLDFLESEDHQLRGNWSCYWDIGGKTHLFFMDERDAIWAKLTLVGAH